MPFRLLQLLLQQVVLTSLTTEHANPQEHPYYDIGFHKANVQFFVITRKKIRIFHRNGQDIRVVSDQFRSPTWVEDIARAIEALLRDKHQGIYHICGGETLSVADIAYRTTQYFGLDTSLIQSVTTEEMNERTPRPLFSPMSTEKAFQ